MSIVKNFKLMPTIMQFIALGGFLAPLVVVISVINNDVTRSYAVNSQYGDASSVYELILVFLFSLPILFASISMIMRYKYYHYMFITGWLIINISPYLLLSVREQFEVVFMGYTINTLIGSVLLGGYLIFSKDVKEYIAN